MEIQIKASSVFRRINAAPTRIIVNEGSSRSTKTFSILQYLIIKCLERPVKVTICRERLTWAKSTVLPDFIEVMQTQFVWDDKCWGKSESIYTFDNGSEIAFIGIDEHQKLHGRKQDYAWVNEAVEVSQEEFRQLLLRTTTQLILDYNPSFESHWIYDSVNTRDDCTLIHSTYRDNPFLSRDIIQEIERLEPTEYNLKQGTADEVSWKIYGLGQRAAHKGLILAKAKIVKQMPNPYDAKMHALGLDFGFTNDPSALVEVMLAHGELWMRQLFYRRGLVNRVSATHDSIEGEMRRLNVSKERSIWGDSAEPKSIAEILSAGYNIQAVEKGPDSVKAGIDVMLRYPINITEDSVDLIKEKNNYKWATDKSGALLNKPIDAWNHAIDAARYAIYMELREIERGGFRIRRA